MKGKLAQSYDKGRLMEPATERQERVNTLFQYLHHHRGPLTTIKNGYDKCLGFEKKRNNSTIFTSHFVTVMVQSNT